jgi:ElaA protein
MLSLECKSFDDLTNKELYELLDLRQQVFVIEQQCIFADMDYKDQKAMHCLGKNEMGKIVAYTRLFDKDVYYKDFTSIGRVVSDTNARSKGYGRKIFAYSIEKIVEIYGSVSIKIGAQAYLEKFYESFGFKSINEDYIEDGIPHKIMVKL